MQRQTLRALLAQLDRAARYEIVSRPEAGGEPVTTAVSWPCGCRATGPSYQELALTPCKVHAPAAAAGDAGPEAGGDAGPAAAGDAGPEAGGIAAG